MRLIVVLLAFALVGLHLGPGPRLTARQQADPEPPARYRVVASLQPGDGLISGTAHISWRNGTPAPASELRLLTPWNRDRSTSGGFVDLSAVLVTTGAAAVDRLVETRAVAPDDGNREDRTVWSVPLEPAVQPGRSVELEVRWKGRVPELASGVGRRGPVLIVAHWIPRVALLTEDGWRAEPRNGVPPVAAFGRYDVDLRLPTGWRIAASGRETKQLDHGDGTTTHRFEADRVPDFAWAGGAGLVERSEQVPQRGGAPVELRVLLQGEHASQGDRHVTAAKATLTAYNDWFGPYPWPSLAIVDVPERRTAGRAEDQPGLAGSHPGLVAVHTPWFTPWSSGALDTAVVRGIGDQFWALAVGADHTENASMGAGISAYVSDRVLEETFRRRFVPVRRSFGGLVIWPIADARSLPFTPQARAPLGFHTLERFFGWEVVRRALAAHFARGRFRHPTTSEFVAIAGSAANRDITWFFNATHRAGIRFDYAIQHIRSDPSGVTGFDSTVVIKRAADGVFPIDTLVTFEDGTSVVDRWDGASDTHTLRFERRARVKTVQIDPAHTLALETNRLNNSWTSQPRGRDVANRWAARWAAWFQHLLLTYAFFV